MLIVSKKSGDFFNPNTWEIENSKENRAKQNKKIKIILDRIKKAVYK